MEPILYTVKRIDGDYAVLIDEKGEENRVAMALLPVEIDEGSRILCELFERENINIRNNHKDCGMMLYDFDEQDIHAGGSGCGCAGSVLCGYFLPKLRAGEIKNILFAATGALMSPTVNQQGESIPSISHLVWLSGEKDMKGAN